jgi:hypothetical protein
VSLKTIYRECSSDSGYVLFVEVLYLVREIYVIYNLYLLKSLFLPQGYILNSLNRISDGIHLSHLFHYVH